MGENFPEFRKDSNPHIEEALQNLSTIKTKKTIHSLVIEKLIKPNGKSKNKAEKFKIYYSKEQK